MVKVGEVSTCAMSMDESSEPEVDDDLDAAVEAACEAEGEAEWDATREKEAAFFSTWAYEWLWNDRSHLSRWFPQFEFLKTPMANLIIFSFGFIAISALIWNLFHGLASGCVPADSSVGCTVDWGTMVIDNMLLQKEVTDSVSAPGEPDWLGSLLIFLSASLLWATMPCDE